MGYRSNTMFVIRGSQSDVTAFLVKARLMLPEPPATSLDGCWGYIKHSIKTPDLAYIWMNGNNWKWNTDFPDIKFFEELWELAVFSDSEESTLEGTFIRIGEDEQDIETRYFGNDPYDLIYVNRSIQVEVEL